jgi:hypothetical protein
MSVVNTARQVGEVIGIALLGALVAHRATFTPVVHSRSLTGSGTVISTALSHLTDPANAARTA